MWSSSGFLHNFRCIVLVQTLMGSSFPGRTLSWSMIPADTGVNLSNASWSVMVDDTCSSAERGRMKAHNRFNIKHRTSKSQPNKSWESHAYCEQCVSQFSDSSVKVPSPAAVDSWGEVSGMLHRDSLPAESPWISSLWKGSRRPKKNRVTGGQMRSWRTAAKKKNKVIYWWKPERKKKNIRPLSLS